MKKTLKIAIAVLLILVLSLWALHLSGITRADAETFASFPGFEEYFDSNPPLVSAPDDFEKALLQSYRPRFFVAAGEQVFIDFYEDYIASGQISNNDGKVLATNPDRELLNRYRDDPSVTFTHQPRSKIGAATVYGRVDYDTLQRADDDLNLIFLTYNLVFPASGLPAGMASWKLRLAGLVGSTRDWHQLDHYVAVTIALNEQHQVVAYTLQQHNYLTTYLPDRQLNYTGLERLQLDIAIGSNELYPHSEAQVAHPAVSFLKAENAKFLIDGSDPPFMAGFDITRGEQEVAYRMKFLPQVDAFYTFKGRLGQHRRLAGRDGPPGADYNTLPVLKPRAVSMVFGYRQQGGDSQYQQWLAAVNFGKRMDLPTDIYQSMVRRFVDTAGIVFDDVEFESVRLEN